MVIPGIKYGIYVGQLLPSCRSIETMLNWLSKYDEGECEIKLQSDITDEDCCQRGPDGNPLGRLTPLVPFQTRGEWLATTTKPSSESRKSFLEWRWEHVRNALVADSKQTDDGSHLPYTIRWNPSAEHWRATFEGAGICEGALVDCMDECENQERQ